MNYKYDKSGYYIEIDYKKRKKQKFLFITFFVILIIILFSGYIAIYIEKPLETGYSTVYEKNDISQIKEDIKMDKFNSQDYYK